MAINKLGNKGVHRKPNTTIFVEVFLKFYSMRLRVKNNGFGNTVR
jgi:hypothetical protein